jgi:hypothetical protein
VGVFSVFDNFGSKFRFRIHLIGHVDKLLSPA